ncbi:hypothetical protein INS49_004465 [Diaporthe citri]|uniref:uncharacterized protein n=1 Tax=Diaporthe citri TaxID=83186 RepID=UPI001C7FD395|nr:uncharacterized protein INS49_004465 [Diaporthe citri]KAG6354448.1 hypothetical protein INS49_004465 [Diaporthe citri]
MKHRRPWRGIALLVLSPLYEGTTIYVMKQFSLEAFCDTIQREKITYAYIVPPVGVAPAKNPMVSKYDLSSLRMLHSSAAPMENELIEAIHERLKVPVKQGYGLSEASPLVAPAELEGLLLAHPAVADVAVVGVYSEQRATELPKAVIVLADSYKGDGEMEKDLKH